VYTNAPFDLDLRRRSHRNKTAHRQRRALSHQHLNLHATLSKNNDSALGRHVSRNAHAITTHVYTHHVALERSICIAHSHLYGGRNISAELTRGGSLSTRFPMTHENKIICLSVVLRCGLTMEADTALQAIATSLGCFACRYANADHAKHYATLRFFTTFSTSFSEA
jgi:hypothetical protein